MKTVFSQDHITKFHSAFMIFDHSKKGYISVYDLESLLKRLNMSVTSREIENMIEKLNRDEKSSKRITFSSFLFLLQERFKDTKTEAQFIEAFKMFDQDQNGLISKADLVKTFKNLGNSITEEESVEKIKEFDWDGDHHLNYMEFVRMMISLR